MAKRTHRTKRRSGFRAAPPVLTSESPAAIGVYQNLDTREYYAEACIEIAGEKKPLCVSTFPGKGNDFLHGAMDERTAIEWGLIQLGRSISGEGERHARKLRASGDRRSTKSTRTTAAPRDYRTDADPDQPYKPAPITRKPRTDAPEDEPRGRAGMTIRRKK